MGRQPAGNKFEDQQVRCFVEPEIFRIGVRSWHALLFAEGVIVDVNVVCLQAVKGMLHSQANEDEE